MNKKNLIDILPMDVQIGAEIGVMRGDASDLMLSARESLKLYMIDPWDMLNPEYFQKDSKFYRKDGGSANWYKIACDVAKKYGDRAVIMKEFSHIASYQFKDGFFDFVFIDGDHSYPACDLDLKLWVPKIKPGGLIIGHDYGTKLHDGVKRAFDEFAIRHNVELKKEDNALVWGKI